MQRMFTVLLLLSHVTRTEGCLDCVSYGADHVPGVSTLDDSYLIGYELVTVFVPSVSECLMTCIYDHCACASMNFKITAEANGTHACGLNYETKDSALEQRLLAVSGYYYVGVEAYNRSKVGSQKDNLISEISARVVR